MDKTAMEIYLEKRKKKKEQELAKKGNALILTELKKIHKQKEEETKE